MPGLGALANGIGAVLVASLLFGCQGSTGSSTPPPSTGTVAMTPPESPPAGPPVPTAAPGNETPTAPSTGAPPASGGTGPTRAVAGAVTVAQASAMPAGSKATVRGLFFGWRGPCAGVPPTRSAWMLADADQKGAPCLYVDGPAPPGLDPSGKGPPTWVRVDAQLVTAGPSTFLVAQHAEREAP